MLRAEETPTRIKELLKQTIALNPSRNYFGKSLTETAERLLFELESLTIGSTFPEILRTDSQGKPFSISDYRGRVVAVVFWAGWCSGCMEKLPSEIELVRQMADKPFVMLGVNEDVEIEDLRKLELKHRVNFRSWHDGRGGPIAAQFYIDVWPVVFVVDGDGKIRYNSKLMTKEVTVESVVGELLGGAALEGTRSTEVAR
jgi:thiol-disulfide isomerase/thioredoxin